MTARTGRDPGELYAALTRELGEPAYERIDAGATAEQRARLGKVTPEDLSMRELAGDPVTAVLTTAPGNQRAFGGIKVMTAQGWFAARPSGTEAVYKLYAESFKGPDHLRAIQEQAQAAIQAFFARA
jgi:phosphoglucomutase